MLIPPRVTLNSPEHGMAAIFINIHLSRYLLNLCLKGVARRIKKNHVL